MPERLGVIVVARFEFTFALSIIYMAVIFCCHSNFIYQALLLTVSIKWAVVLFPAEKCLVYKATVTTENDSHVYYGQCEGEFKARYNNHTKSFRHRKYENETELSKHVWMLKDSNKSYKVVWCIVARAPPYKSGPGRCALCLTEKSVIVRANPKGLLNKMTELISKCRHRNKYLLCNIPSPQRSIK